MWGRTRHLAKLAATITTLHYAEETHGLLLWVFVEIPVYPDGFLT